MSQRLPEVVQLAGPPRLTRLYATALRPVRSRPQSLPELELVLGDVAVDRDHLAAYTRVCGFRLSDRLPPTYPHVLAFPVQVQLMTDPTFPFGLAGMVHIRNVITARRAISADARLTFRVQAERLAAHPSGAQVDLVVAGYDDDAPVWTSRSTYLARGAVGPGPAATADAPVAPVDLSRYQGATWRVRKDVGRRYARVSGDINPLHLHPLSARLFGFPGAIAHGMWTKARCLAALDARLPDALTADVTFQRPLPLPSVVRFVARRSPDRWDFGVLPAAEGRPHLTGSVTSA
jgi:acyl dehydratase